MATPPVKPQKEPILTPTVYKVVRVFLTLFLTLLTVFFIQGARGYSQATTGCGEADYIAPDYHTTIGLLLAALLLAVFVVINIRVLSWHIPSRIRWFERIWVQLGITTLIILLSFISAITSEHLFAGWCMY